MNRSASAQAALRWLNDRVTEARPTNTPVEQFEALRELVATSEVDRWLEKVREESLERSVSAVICFGLCVYSQTSSDR